MLRKLIAAAFFATIAGSGAARADTTWLSMNVDMVEKSGRWFIGAGAAGGTYHMPDWNSTTTARVPNAGLPPNTGAAELSTDLTLIVPGGTLGYVLPDGTLPAWMGRSVRVSLTGAYVGGYGSSQSSILVSPSAQVYQTSVDGRFGAGTGIGTPALLTDRIKIDQDGFELALRIASDMPIGPGLVISPSLGVFGGYSKTTFDHTGKYFLPTLALNAAAHSINEELSTMKVGLDVGLGVTWRPWSNIALSMAGRAGMVWKRAQLDASDCYQFGIGISECTTPQGAPFTGLQFATSTDDEASKFGFAGSVYLAATYDGGWVVLTVGGFFGWESAVAGVRNPVNSVGIAAVGSQIARPASVQFGSGWKAGGFVTVRIFLQ